MLKSYRFTTWFGNGLVYLVLTAFAVIMLFPFVYMLTTSFKTPADTFRYPPKVLPYDQATVDVAGYEGEQPLYFVDFNGDRAEFALVEKNIPVGQYVDPANPGEPIVLRLSEAVPTGGEANQSTTIFEGDEEDLWDVTVNGQIVPMVQVGRTTVGEFVDPADPTRMVEQNVRLSEPVETVKLHPENYTEVLRLRSMDRSLSNTALVTILVMLGQLTTSVVGGYAFARLKFPGPGHHFPHVPGHHHDPLRAADRAPLPAHGPGRLGGHVDGLGDPVGLHGLRHLPHAPVFHHHSPGDRGGRPVGRRVPLADFVAHLCAGQRARPGQFGHLHLPLRLE